MAYQRPKTTDRGYGTDHQAERHAWQIALDAGEEVLCSKCHEPPLITRDTAWDLGHNPDRTGWDGPQHPGCNRSDGARNSHRSQQLTVREW